MRPKGLSILGSVRKHRRDLMKRIASMPGVPAERFRYLRLFKATGRTRRRTRFMPIGKTRGRWDQIAKNASALMAAFPAGSFLGSLQSMARVDERQVLLTSIEYIATKVKIMAIEERVMQRRK